MSSFTLQQGRSISFSIPWTKTTREEGADIIITGRDGPLDPIAAFDNHRIINKDLPSHFPFFAFFHQGSARILTKQAFITRVRDIWSSHPELDFVHGHSFRPGGATELLLSGVPPETVAKLGRWKSLSFLLYWRKLQELIPSMINSSYDDSRLRSVELEFERFRISNHIPNSMPTVS